MSGQAIVTENLNRIFSKKGKKRLDALTDINIQVDKGEIFGFLGPNGAGKTTLIKILTTLLYPSSGSAIVAGYDVVKEAAKVRPLINMVSGGETSGYGILNVYENIWMFSQFYGLPSKVAKKRIDYYLQKFDLADDARTKINRLSTGMRQKMNIIRGLVTDPQILFLDEPTLGLDVHIARQVRQFMHEWVTNDENKTLFLTTHYMAEAEQLCDRIAIIDRGKIVACDTPGALRRQLGKESIFTFSLIPGPTDLSMFDSIPEAKDPYFGKREARDNSVEVKFQLEDESDLADVLAAVKQQGFKVARFSKEEASLEDLFMKIVGRQLEHGE